MNQIVNWRPTLNLPFIPHPTLLSETSNLSIITPPTPTITNHNILYQEIVNKISTLQHETILYASEALKHQGGYLLGDATGVGKTRIIAGIILNMFHLWISQNNNITSSFFKCIWLSSSQILIKGIVEEMKVLQTLLPKNIPRLNIISKIPQNDNNTNYYVLYSTYTKLCRPNYYEKIVDWLDNKVEILTHGLIVMDECHIGRNSNSKINKKLIQFQNELRHLPVLYSTATAASDINHMKYMSRLNIWGENSSIFLNHKSFCEIIKKWGQSAMEMLPLEMKSRGVYCSRQLSMEGVIFNINNYKLIPNQRKLYNRYVNHMNISNQNIHMKDKLAFFRRLIGAFKAYKAIEITKKALHDGYSVVVALQTTGATADSLKNTFLKLLNNNNNEADNTEYNDIQFPHDIIDAFITEFGPNQIAEITGRSIQTYKGEKIKKATNKQECKSFQLNQKRIAIISKAGSVGISLHSQNIDNEISRKRLHLIVELPWSANDFVQQCGRTHRTDQRFPPEYCLIISDVPGESRFIHTIIKRMKTLGALTKGDSHSTIIDKMSMLEELSTKTVRRMAFKFLFDKLLKKVHNNNQNNNDCNNEIKLLNKKYINLINKIYKYGFDYISENYEIYDLDLKCNYMFKSFKKISDTLILQIMYFIIYINDIGIQNVDTLEEFLTSSIRFPSLYLSNDISKVISKDFLIKISKLENIYKEYYLCLPCILLIIILKKPFTRCWITKWSKENHVKYPKFFKNQVLTLLIACGKPETSNTLGKLPHNIIMNIIQMISNPLESLETINNFDLQQTIKSSPTQILNNMLCTNLDIQNVIQQNLMVHSIEMNEYEKKTGIIDMNTFILSSCAHEDFTINYKSQEIDVTSPSRSSMITSEESLLKGQFVMLQVLVQYNELYDDILQWINNNQKNIEGLYKSAKGTLLCILLRVNNKNYDYELWYPGRRKPSRCYTKQRWQYDFKERCMYELCYSLTNNSKIPKAYTIKFIDQGKSFSNVQKKRAERMSCNYLVCKKGIFENWEHDLSTKKVVKIKNVNAHLPQSETFIGLLMTKKDYTNYNM